MTDDVLLLPPMLQWTDVSRWYLAPRRHCQKYWKQFLWKKLLELNLAYALTDNAIETWIDIGAYAQHSGQLRNRLKGHLDSLLYVLCYIYQLLASNMGDQWHCSYQVVNLLIRRSKWVSPNWRPSFSPPACRPFTYIKRSLLIFSSCKNLYYHCSASYYCTFIPLTTPPSQSQDASVRPRHFGLEAPVKYLRAAYILEPQISNFLHCASLVSRSDTKQIEVHNSFSVQTPYFPTYYQNLL